MKALLYCTKGKPYLYQGFARPMHTLDTHNPFNYKWHLLKKTKTSAALNGKIIGECDYEVSEIEFKSAFYLNGPVYITKRKEPFRYFSYSDLLKASCLQDNEILKYLGHKNGKAIHIKNLKVFDKPKELNDYNVYTPGVLYGGEYLVPLKNAPQNMMYCYEYVKTKSNGLTGMSNGHIVKKVIVSIRPEWLCKILNGEKTIEVRKKVLKEML